MADIATAISGGRTLTKEGKEQFAYELALGYFDAESLRRRFKLIPAAFAKYIQDEEMIALVSAKKREIDESDFALKLLARRAARAMLEMNLGIARDPEAPAKTRMEASKLIREMAQGVDKRDLKDTIDPTEKPVVIRTNLDVEGAKGVYAITSKDIDEQMKKNEAERAASEREADDIDPELAALLGM